MTARARASVVSKSSLRRSSRNLQLNGSMYAFCWLTYLNQLQSDAVRIHPPVKCTARKFGSPVCSHCHEIAAEAGSTVRCPIDIEAGDALVDDDVDSLFRELVDDGHALQAAAVGKCIHHEID
jgi:hypothetical protein